MATKKPGQIAWVMDPQISPERTAILTRTINSLRQHLSIQILRAVNEDDVLRIMENEEVDLLLAPLPLYLKWAKIEGFLGIHRTQGPTFAGYFSEPLPFYKITELSNRPHTIVLDLVHSNVTDLLVWLRCLLHDNQRAGIRALLDPQTPLYCESWYGNQGQGSRADQILHLPEIAKTDWIKRSSALRLILTAFWTLVYEEGPGKIDQSQGTAKNAPRAYFQIGANESFLAFRLHYHLSHKPQDVLSGFFPNSTTPTRAGQILLRYSDFLRIHPIADTADIEVVVALSTTAPSEKSADYLRTLWIEPLASRCVVDTPYEAPSPKNPLLRALPSAQFQAATPRLVSDTSDASKKALERASTQIQELRRQVSESTETIRELKQGGVGTAAPPPPPDIESLLEAFQQRYFEARFQIREFELKIRDLEQKKHDPKEIETLRLKMDALANREKAWIKKLAASLELYRKARADASS